MIVMIKSKNKPYYVYNCENTTYFYTAKDRYEYAMLDKKAKVLYINRSYKNRFKNILASIKKDYDISAISEYCNMI